ncbi:MAG: hypothetical protein HY361_05650 [Candidatus Aenigmarchaeota archaeon]|nr:hypothetical protein [Candidatus Aenigmarchaeota archaeon]
MLNLKRLSQHKYNVLFATLSTICLALLPSVHAFDYAQNYDDNYYINFLLLKLEGLVNYENSSTYFKAIMTVDLDNDSYSIKFPYIQTQSFDLPTKNYTYIFDGTAPEIIKVSQRTSANKTYDAYFYYDGLANFIQFKRPADGSQQIVKNLFYDGLGRVASEQNPYFDSFSTGLSTPSTAVNSTNYTFDALGRVTFVRNPDGTNKTINFNHRIITAYDENGHRKAYVLDGYDRIQNVLEYNNDPVLKVTSEEVYNTSYEYDEISFKNEFHDLFSLVNINFKVFKNSFSAKQIERGTKLAGEGDPRFNFLISNNHSDSMDVSYEFCGGSLKDSFFTSFNVQPKKPAKTALEDGNGSSRVYYSRCVDFLTILGDNNWNYGIIRAAENLIRKPHRILSSSSFLGTFINITSVNSMPFFLRASSTSDTESPAATIPSLVKATHLPLYFSTSLGCDDIHSNSCIQSTSPISNLSLFKDNSFYNDLDLGNWTYQYDLVGNLIKQMQNGGGNLVGGDGYYREYDGLNQLIKIRNGTSTSPIVENYTYDPFGQRIKIVRNEMEVL